MSEYKKDVLVSTDWVAEHLHDAGVQLIEVDVDTAAYESGHIDGAIAWNWTTQLNDNVRRDILTRDAMASLLSSSGVTEDKLIVLYGDNNNWFAAYAYWQLKLFGHEAVKLMNGGRKKWELEGRPFTKEVPQIESVSYDSRTEGLDIRAHQPQVQDGLLDPNLVLVDVRSPQEFTGEVIAPPGMSETAQRGGHIPGAKNVPWAKAANEDGTFKSYPELQEIYGQVGVTRDASIVTYCRIGERSAHTWFVLHELLGFDRVRNYDGSWTEWGSMVGTPIER